jgi:hypothetical protein
MTPPPEGKDTWPFASPTVAIVTARKAERKPETRNQKPEIRNQKPETRNQKLETRN